MRTQWMTSWRNALVFFPTISIHERPGFTSFSIISMLFRTFSKMNSKWLPSNFSITNDSLRSTVIRQFSVIRQIVIIRRLNKNTSFNSLWWNVESWWIHMNFCQYPFFVTQKWPTIPSFISGQFFELTATLEAAVLLGRRLVLPDNWDCSALESRGNLWKACWLKQGFFEDRNVRCLEFLPTQYNEIILGFQGGSCIFMLQAAETCLFEWACLLKWKKAPFDG